MKLLELGQGFWLDVQLLNYIVYLCYFDCVLKYAGDTFLVQCYSYTDTNARQVS